MSFDYTGSSKLGVKYIEYGVNFYIEGNKKLY